MDQQELIDRLHKAVEEEDVYTPVWYFSLPSVSSQQQLPPPPPPLTAQPAEAPWHPPFPPSTSCPPSHQIRLSSVPPHLNLLELSWQLPALSGLFAINQVGSGVFLLTFPNEVMAQAGLMAVRMWNGCFAAQSEYAYQTSIGLLPTPPPLPHKPLLPPKPPDFPPSLPFNPPSSVLPHASASVLQASSSDASTSTLIPQSYGQPCEAEAQATPVTFWVANLPLVTTIEQLLERFRQAGVEPVALSLCSTRTNAATQAAQGILKSAADVCRASSALQRTEMHGQWMFINREPPPLASPSHPFVFLSNPSPSMTKNKLGALAKKTGCGAYDFQVVSNGGVSGTTTGSMRFETEVTAQLAVIYFQCGYFEGQPLLPSWRSGPTAVHALPPPHPPPQQIQRNEQQQQAVQVATASLGKGLPHLPPQQQPPAPAPHQQHHSQSSASCEILDLTLSPSPSPSPPPHPRSPPSLSPSYDGFATSTSPPPEGYPSPRSAAYSQSEASPSPPGPSTTMRGNRKRRNGEESGAVKGRKKRREE
ncbi:hypothetical protein JCM8547_004366 [Rhodosporidiobolus lusitaniae]